MFDVGFTRKHHHAALGHLVRGIQLDFGCTCCPLGLVRFFQILCLIVESHPMPHRGKFAYIIDITGHQARHSPIDYFFRRFHGG